MPDNKIFPDQLAALNRYSLIGMMCPGIAHEINNPASAIAANSEVLKSLFAGEGAAGENDFRDDVLEIADLLYRNSLKLTSMTKVLKDFLVFSEDKRGSCDLEAAIRKTTEIMTNKLKYRIKTELSLAPLITVKCACGEVCQIIMNLLANSAEAIAGNGVIAVKTFKAGKNMAAAEISDTGSGIAAGLDIFAPFVTARADEGHAGTGLYVSRQIAEKVGGSLEVAETSKDGTVMRLLLPLSQAGK